MKPEPLAVSIDYQIGFFAQLSWCLRLLDAGEKQGCPVFIRLTSNNYARPNESWLDYFFLNPQPPAEVKWQHINHLRELIDEVEMHDLSRQEAHDLFYRHFSLRPEVSDYVTRFAAQNFGCQPVIGLHYRGKDKHIEAPAVAWCDIVNELESRLIQHNYNDLVFVASDEPRFADHLRHELPDARIVTHPDTEVDDLALARHDRVVGDAYRKGFEALVNCLLLARTDQLIKTCSALSGWSAIFNPDLPVTLLNEPHAQCCWFPDKILRTKNPD